MPTIVLFGTATLSALTLTEPNTSQTTFRYDANYHRTSTTYPNGVTMTQSYDAGGRLLSIVGSKGSSTLTSFGYTYANGASDTSLRRTMTDTAGNVSTYSYDVLNRLLEASTTGASPADFRYTYDRAGNRKTQTVNGGTPTNYTYNAANELTAVGSTTSCLDGNGNQTANSAGLALTYNAKDQTTSITPSSAGLVGDQAVESNVDNDSAGQAEAFSFTQQQLGPSTR
jgi:YD repeat-containing protein